MVMDTEAEQLKQKIRATFKRMLFPLVMIICVPALFVLASQIFLLGNKSVAKGGGIVLELLFAPGIIAICLVFLVLAGISLIRGIILGWYWGYKYQYVKQRIIYLSCTVLILLAIGGGISYLIFSAVRTNTIACLTPHEVTNRYTPVDLSNSYEQCLKEKRVEDAYFLKQLFFSYLEFDKLRAGNTDTALKTETKLTKKMLNIMQDSHLPPNVSPQQFEQICQDLKEVGVPNYYPRYMVVEGGLQKNVNLAFVWKIALYKFHKCTMQFTGTMAVTHERGCITAAQVTNKDTPVDLLESAAQCVRENKPEDALFLQTVASVYENFDKARVKDKVDARQASRFLAVLRTQVREQRKYYNWHQGSTSAIRDAIDRIGMPSYEPHYMSSNGLLADFDAQSIWKKAKLFDKVTNL